MVRITRNLKVIWEEPRSHHALSKERIRRDGDAALLNDFGGRVYFSIKICFKYLFIFELLFTHFR